MTRLTPQDIREHDFKQSALGFSREQVHAFLEEVAEELETLIRESNAMHVENKELKLELQTYRNVEESLKETLLLAQRTGQEAIRNAQAEADTVLRKAATEKDALLFTAKEELKETQEQIRSLKLRRDDILDRLKRLLSSNLHLLEDLFKEAAPEEKLGPQDNEASRERFVDFSKQDLSIEDLSQEEDEDDTKKEEPFIRL